MESRVEIYYKDRVKHVKSLYQTNDDELEFARTIEDSADVIEVITSKDGKDVHTEVNVYTEQAVYHFQKFRADYLGHASRTLAELLLHFTVSLPVVEFIIEHQTFVIYLNGEKIVVGETLEGKVSPDDELNQQENVESDDDSMSDNEHPIRVRNGVFELVLFYQDFLSITAANRLQYLCNYYGASEIDVIESAVTAMWEHRVHQDEEAELERTKQAIADQQYIPASVEPQDKVEQSVNENWSETSEPTTVLQALSENEPKVGTSRNTSIPAAAIVD